MTFDDLYEQLKFDSDDRAADYQQAARRWLNLARSTIVDFGQWKSALDTEASLTTSAATTTGVYSIGAFEFIHGLYMYDQSTNSVIVHESLSTAGRIDPDRSVTGPPTIWADAGADTSGNRQVYFWPVPDDTRTIDFHGYRQLADITDSDGTKSIDPFFGRLTEWQSCFSDGMRYYHDLNNNESAQQTFGQWGKFKNAIKRRHARNRLSLGAPISLRSIRGVRRILPGRLDPAHFRN